MAFFRKSSPPTAPQDTVSKPEPADAEAVPVEAAAATTAAELGKKSGWLARLK
jgi:hypothetical protein